MRRRIMSLAAAAMLAALSLPAAASAAVIPETFTVAASLTVLNVPASITYVASGGGSLQAGQTSQTYAFTPQVTSNGTVSVTFDGAGFTGPANLSQDIREANISNASGFTLAGGLGSWQATTAVEAANPIATASQPNAGTFDVWLRVNVPGSAVPGGYSSSLTLSFTAS